MINKTIYEDGNGGQLTFINNDIATSESLSTLAYIAMFGGNRESDTKPISNSKELNFDWWGNDKEKPSSTWINSQTERTLMGIALNSSTVEIIKQAVKKDTNFLNEYGSVNVSISLISLNRVKIEINIEEPGGTENERLSLIWDNTKNEIILNNTL